MHEPNGDTRRAYSLVCSYMWSGRRQKGPFRREEHAETPGVSHAPLARASFAWRAPAKQEIEQAAQQLQDRKT